MLRQNHGFEFCQFQWLQGVSALRLEFFGISSAKKGGESLGNKYLERLIMPDGENGASVIVTHGVSYTNSSQCPQATVCTRRRIILYLHECNMDVFSLFCASKARLALYSRSNKSGAFFLTFFFVQVPSCWHTPCTIMHRT